MSQTRIARTVRPLVSGESEKYQLTQLSQLKPGDIFRFTDSDEWHIKQDRCYTNLHSGCVGYDMGTRQKDVIVTTAPVLLENNTENMDHSEAKVPIVIYWYGDEIPEFVDRLNDQLKVSAFGFQLIDDLEEYDGYIKYQITPIKP